IRELNEPGTAERLTRTYLEGVVVGIEGRFNRIDGVIAEVGTDCINARVVGTREDGVAGGGVQAGGEGNAGIGLVEVDHAYEMSSFGGRVGDVENCALVNVALDAHAPLLHVRDVVGQLRGAGEDGGDSAGRSTGGNIAEGRIAQSRALHERRVLKDGLFVSAEEAGIVVDAIAGAERGLAAAGRVPGGADAGSEAVVLIRRDFAAKRRGLTADDDAVGVRKIRGAGDDVACGRVDLRSGRGGVKKGVEGRQFAVRVIRL